MTRDDVDAFYAAARRSLPAHPDFREGNRVGERRATLPIVVDGEIARIRVHLTVKLADPAYLIALVLAADRCISRLCIGPGHFDRLARRQCDEPHFHGWTSNRPASKTLPRELPRYELVPPGHTSRTAGFAWFLDQNGIDLPHWWPPNWPENQGFL